MIIEIKIIEIKTVAQEYKISVVQRPVRNGSMLACTDIGVLFFSFMLVCTS